MRPWPFIAVLLWFFGPGRPPLRAAPLPGDPRWFTPAPNYPERARMHSENGTGRLLVVTGDDGWVRQARMVESTGSKTLDRYTEQFVLSNWRGPANSQRTISFDYRLGKPSGSPAASPGFLPYQRTVRAAVRARWDVAMRQFAALGAPQIGTVEVNFDVGEDGQTSNVRVVNGKEHGRLAALTVRAVHEASIPPFPAELRAELRRRSPRPTALPVSFTFSLQD